MFSARYYLLLKHNILAAITPHVCKISTGSTSLAANYYEALGISKNSTQSEIKSAYYRLSMLYHPDKNKGSDTAAKKFREITQAYEVLGNFRLRRLYDKGIIHTAGSQYKQQYPETENDEEKADDDDSTKFYKSRFTKSTVSDSQGRTPIYDFDEWSKAHYGKSFNRKKNAKTKHDKGQVEKKEHTFAAQKEFLLFITTFVCVLLYLNFMAEASYDTPKEKSVKAVEEKHKKIG